jgi:sugar phosphate isomerase/epimerase
MPRLSMNEMTTFRWSFEEDVQHYREAGIPAIGVWRQKLADFGKERGIDLVQESGLAVSNLMWAGGFTGSDGHTHREAIDDALEAIRLAAALKSPCLVVYSGSRGGHTTNHARRLLTTALKELAPVAAEFGVKLALEPMHTACSREWTFLNGLSDTLNMLEQVGSRSVQIVFDTYHFGWQPDAMAQIPALASRIGVVHLADGWPPSDSEQIRSKLGDGEVPLAEIVGALSTAGYDGDYDVELLGPDLEHADYFQLLAHSKKAYETLVERPAAATH